MTAAPLITLEEYARMPNPVNGMLDDLIEGVVVQRPLHSALHGVVSTAVGSFLTDYKSRSGGSATLRVGMVVSRSPDSVVSADAAYWGIRESVILEQGWPTIPPEAGFEIVDVREPYTAVLRRVRLLLNFGVGVLWLVDPVGEEVVEYRGANIRRFGRSETLTGGDVLPGFSCKVAALFG